MADTLNAMRSRLSATDRTLFDDGMRNVPSGKIRSGRARRLSPAEYNQQVKAMEEEREKLGIRD